MCCISICCMPPISLIVKAVLNSPNVFQPKSTVVADEKVGNRLLEVLGGRAIHPINVAVGGFYRSPDPTQLDSLNP